jgi:hypothetical protein
LAIEVGALLQFPIAADPLILKIDAGLEKASDWPSHGFRNFSAPAITQFELAKQAIANACCADYLAGLCKHGSRHFETNCLGGLDVTHV